MEKRTSFTHDLRGANKPQILLIGNGLERACCDEKKDWQNIIDAINVRYSDGAIPEPIKKLPFPLQYELLATAENASGVFTKEEMKAEEQRLAGVMKGLLRAPDEIVDKDGIFKHLNTLGVDHVFTTNYSYCPEKSFLPSSNFANDGTRGRHRFNLNPATDESGKPKREVNYRIHTGYSVPAGGKSVGIWHIHGECSVPTGVVLGHDRYGRLLSRIVQTCCGIDFENGIKNKTSYDFRSWPELFLFGDIYVLGFGFYDCEFDLWWLLRRKQRETYSDGRVFYYTYDPVDPANIHQLLLQSHGVELVTMPDARGAGYGAFYRAAMDDIKWRISLKRGE